MMFSRYLLRVLLMLVGFYQTLISPLLPARCRYYPTCSQYGRQALLWHGVWRGSLLLVKRLLRCQPWGGSGIDYVPLPLEKYTYYRSSQMVGGVHKDGVSYLARRNHLMKN